MECTMGHRGVSVLLPLIACAAAAAQGMQAISFPAKGWAIEPGKDGASVSATFEAAEAGKGVGAFSFDKPVESWAGLMFTGRDQAVGRDFRIELRVRGSPGPGWQVLLQEASPVPGETIPYVADIPKDGGSFTLSARDFRVREDRRDRPGAGGRPKIVNQLMINAPWKAGNGELVIESLAFYPGTPAGSVVRVKEGRGFVMTGYSTNAYSEEARNIVSRYVNATIGVLVTHYFNEKGKVVSRPDRTPAPASVAALISDIVSSGNRPCLFLYADFYKDGEWRSRKGIDLDDLKEAYLRYLGEMGSSLKDVGLVVVGAEFNAVEEDDGAWQRLIYAVRARFPKGVKLGYAASHSSILLDGSDQVARPWVGLLDFFGVTLWSGAKDLADQKKSYATLIGILNAAKGLKEGARRFVAEVGFPSTALALQDPANPSGVSGKEHEEDQEKALANILSCIPPDTPAFLWRIEPGAAADPYSWIGKRSEGLVDAWLRGESLDSTRAAERPVSLFVLKDSLAVAKENSKYLDASRRVDGFSASVFEGTAPRDGKLRITGSGYSKADKHGSKGRLSIGRNEELRYAELDWDDSPSRSSIDELVDVKAGDGISVALEPSDWGTVLLALDIRMED